MKFYVEQEQVFELSEVDMTLLKSHINEDMLADDLKRRAKYIIEHLRDQVWKEFFQKWSAQMMQEGTAIPPTREAFITAVVSRPDYETSKVRQEKASAARAAALGIQ
jgi:transcription initiation factor IIF auxiliary subunit